MWGILMGSMLPYIAAPWILWEMRTGTIPAQDIPVQHAETHPGRPLGDAPP